MRFRCAELFGDMRNDLGLAEWLSFHLVWLSSCRFFPARRFGRAANFFRLPRTLAKKTRAGGTIANTASERKCNWPKNAVKMRVFIGTCGNHGHFSGFSGTDGANSRRRDILLLRSHAEIRCGRVTNGKFMERIGTKNLRRGGIAEASGASRILGCGSCGTGKIFGH